MVQPQEEKLLEDKVEDKLKMSQMWQKQREELTETEIRAAVKLIGRKSSMMRILRFLKENGISSVNEITEGINNVITQVRVTQILVKMFQAGVLNCGVTKIDANWTFYELSKDFPYDEALLNFKKFVGVKLGSLIIYGKTFLVSDLQNNMGFTALLLKYGLTFEEGIACLMLNTRSIEVISSYGKLVGFKRK